MQRLILFILLSGLISCQKEIGPVTSKNDYPELKVSLRDSLSAVDCNQLDFARVSRATIDSGRVVWMRIAFKEKKFDEQFVLVKVNPKGQILEGKIVQLIAEQTGPTFNGHLLVQGLKRNVLKDAAILNGYLIDPAATRAFSHDGSVLPEVVLYASYPASGGVSWVTWMRLVSFTDGGGSMHGEYLKLDPFAGGGGSSGGNGTDGGFVPGGGGQQLPVIYEENEMMIIDFEHQYDDPAIDLETFINCFTAIPDAGATCKVTIFTDVPVNNDPTKIFDWTTGSPGHVFVNFSKDNGSQHTSQFIGFYPKTGWKVSVTPAPVDGKYVSNSYHEFNASYEVTIPAGNFYNGLMEMIHRRNMLYSLDNNNCTDWAMLVFEAAAGYGPWFDIPIFHVPGSLNPNGSRTPQGLYERLNQLKNTTPGIVVPLVGWAGSSTGPCN